MIQYQNRVRELLRLFKRVLLVKVSREDNSRADRPKQLKAKLAFSYSYLDYYILWCSEVFRFLVVTTLVVACRRSCFSCFYGHMDLLKTR